MRVAIGVSGCSEGLDSETMKQGERLRADEPMKEARKIALAVEQRSLREPRRATRCWGAALN